MHVRKLALCLIAGALLTASSPPSEGAAVVRVILQEARATLPELDALGTVMGTTVGPRFVDVESFRRGVRGTFGEELDPELVLEAYVEGAVAASPEHALTGWECPYRHSCGVRDDGTFVRLWALGHPWEGEGHLLVYLTVSYTHRRPSGARATYPYALRLCLERREGGWTVAERREVGPVGFRAIRTEELVCRLG